MFRTDFTLIKHFSPMEVRATGAKLEDVQFVTIHCLDRLRTILGKPIKLLRNGLTTGKHSSKLHGQGKAVDFYVVDIEEHDIIKLLLAASSIGFTDMGVYKNTQGVYSFHLGLGSNYKTWSATKDSHGNWVYKALTIKF